MSIENLKDRRVLVSRDIDLLRTEASHVYYQCVVDGHEELYELYNYMTSKLDSLETDLKMICTLIEEGTC